jgi:signal transduction histidine kinase
MGPAGRLMDFDEIRRFAADNWIDGKARDDYMERSSAAYVKARLDERGEFELTVPGHYSDIPDSIMCRKIQHFYLDSRKEEILLIETDVTEAYLRQLREAEQAKAEAQRANDIMDCISSGVSVLYMPDPDHLAVDYVNRQLFRILKYDSIDGLAQRAAQADKAPLRAFFDDGFSVIHPEDRERVRKTFRENFASDRFSVEPYRMPCQNGEYVWLAEEVILRGVTDEHRVFYATFRDVTDEKRMQEELAENYKKEKALRSEAIAANTAKSEFLSRMSHDMRTPLNGIIGMTYITREMDLPQAAQENLQKIDTSSKFLLNLINDVLDMTKAESGKIELHPEPYSMEDFIRYIEAVIRPLCQEKNQDLIIDAEPAEDVVPLMDELRINQIYFNIFSNAVKYTPEGGTILFRLRCRHLENCRVSAESCVSDTGIGMSRDFQKVIFEPFTQEHRSDISEMRGTGLGLSIVKRLVDAMGGRITVTSEPGVGTSFNLSMEFDCVGADTCRKAEADVPRQPGESSGLRGKHVLLCEDHPLNQEIATALLEKMGLKVELAENGQTGLYMFRRSNIGFYDAILMDIRMPVMGGYEASRAIRALPRADAKTVPIIAMTADAFAEDVQKCFDAGMNAHIAKPIDPGKLLSELSSLL